MPIITQSGQFLENLYHVDTLQSGVHRVASSFIFYDNDVCILMDVGTSDEVRGLIRSLKKLEIPFSKVAGITVTHYHFDHGGGSTKLWSKIYEKNPDFKIMVPEDTYFFLQHSEKHLIGARTTFGDLVGTMNPAPENAYQIIKKDADLPIKIGNGYKIHLLSTPGHSPDHCSHIVYKNNKPIFVFTGEAAGTLFHGSKLVSLPTSMPPNFNFQEYMKSLQKIIEIDPIALGFCHFGVILDEFKEETKIFLQDQVNYITNFRNTIIKAFKEEPTTKHVMESIKADLWEDRVDPLFKESAISLNFFKNLKLALVYGMMIDLGFRQPKYEQK